MAKWIFTVNRHENSTHKMKGIDVYKKRMRHKFWGIKDNVNYRLNLKPNDLVIFYLAGPGGQKFIGECTLKSAYCKLNKEEHKKVYESPFFETDLGVKLENPILWDERISIRPLLDVLQITKNLNPKYWGIALHHSIVVLNEKDYQLILKAKNEPE